MQITVAKSELVKLLHITQAIAEKKTTMPILGNLLLQADDNKLRITGSDLEITAVASGSANVSKKGSITVSSRMFGDIVRELPDGDVTITLADRDRVEISAGRSKLKMIGISADEYPVPPGLSLPVENKISAKILIEMINKTVYAVSLDEGRYNMSGVCVEVTDKSGLRMVATDGHRLSLITRETSKLKFSGLSPKSQKSGPKDHLIVPRKGLLEIRKALEIDPEREVSIDVNEGFFLVETGGTKLVVRVIDSEFPDYSQVLPKDKGTKVTVLSSDLSQALKRVALMVSDKSKGVRLDFSQDSVRVSSSSPELGEATEEVSIEYKGPQISVGFNARYILDVLASAGETQPFVMELFGETGPGRFSVESDDSFLAIVMPLRLD